MKLILHIGEFKTGSTAIQSFLENNYDNLLKQGILVPKFLNSNKSFIKVNNHRLIAEALVNMKLLEAKIPSLDYNVRFDDLFSSMKLQALENKVDTVIISNERLSILQNEGLIFVDNFFSKFFEEIEIMYILRTPASYYLSTISERSKRILDVGDFNFGKKLKSKSIFANYKKHFDNITIVPLKRNPDVIKYLCNRLDLRFEDMNQPTRTNPKLPIEFIALFNEFNKLDIDFDFLNFQKKIKFQNSAFKSDQFFQFSKEEIEAINDNTIEQSRELIELYNSHIKNDKTKQSLIESDFIEPLDNYPEKPQWDELNYENAFKALTYFFKELLEENAQQKAEITNLKESNENKTNAKNFAEAWALYHKILGKNFIDNDDRNKTIKKFKDLFFEIKHLPIRRNEIKNFQKLINKIDK